ncbi:MAG: amino acid ABC transporter substrate-binding protein, partial [Gemmataceae bacterium]
LVKWTLFAMIDSEQLGITSRNVDEMSRSVKPEFKRVFGAGGNFGRSLGVTNDWVVRIIKAVGNYGQSFDRNLGAGSPLQMARGINRLWTKGGILYAPPLR